MAVFNGGETGALSGVMAALLPRVDSMIDGSMPDSARRLAEYCGNAGTILWAGEAGLQSYCNDGGLRPAGSPAGAQPPASVLALHNAMRRGVRTIICSEEDKRFGGLAPPNAHVSSGPRAFLEYLERLSLPGITVLDPSGR